MKPMPTTTKMTVTKLVVPKETTPPKKLIRQISNISAGSSVTMHKILNKAPDTTKVESSRPKAEQNEKTVKNTGPDYGVQAETIRENVVKTLSAGLKQRMNNADDSSAFKLKADEIEDFIRGVEEELYRFYNGESNSKYKARYRQLSFNIKDPKNQTLFRKIFYKEVSPKQLAHMSVEELASQELAQWRKQENQHQLDIIKKCELDMLSCNKNLVVKTHKGEEIIEVDHSEILQLDPTTPVEDVVTVLNKSSKSSNFLEKLHSPGTRKEYGHVSLIENDQMSFSTSTLELDKNAIEKEKKEEMYKQKYKDREKEKDREKTRERDREKDKDRHERRHRSRERQKSRKRSKSRSRSPERSQERQDRPEKKYKSSTNDRHRERDKERKKYDEKSRGRDKARARDGGEREKEREKEQFKESSKDRKQSTSLIDHISNKTKIVTTQKDKKEHKESKDATRKPHKTTESFSLIDQILENTKTVEEAANLVPEKKREHTNSPATLPHLNKQISMHDSDQEPSSTITSPPQDPYARFAESDIHQLWSGNLNMIDVASFKIIMKPLLGNSLHMSHLLPTELDVVGRISPDTVWDYILKIKKGPNKEIVLVKLLPATRTETSAYQVLLQYLDKRNRLGVIKNTSLQIKDFYMVPLVAGKRLPSVLQSMENHAFFEDNDRPDMLIGIVIRIFGKRTHPQPVLSATLPPTSSLKHRRTTDISVSSPMRKRHSNLDPSAKDDGFDIDAIIKAPIAGKIMSKSKKSI